MTAAAPEGRYEEQWWRALAVFRVASLLYAAGVYLRFDQDYAHPAGGWLVLGGMAVWTAVAVWAYADPARRRWPLLTADLLVALAALLSSRPLQGEALAEAGTQTITITWVVAPVIAWALVHGWVAALPAAALVGAANVAHRGAVTAALLHNTVLVLLAGVFVGYVAALGRRAERQLAAALRAQAAVEERERLGRVVHDGVLQVLGLVARRGRELGGEAAELGRLAAEQEVALRSLVTSHPPPPPSPIVRTSTRHAVGSGESRTIRGAGEVDLREPLQRLAAPRVSVAAPADPVLLPAHEAEELGAAVRAALDNVARHAGAGARAYVLLEDGRGSVRVTVRDDGAGLAPGRLEAAVAEGRMGVASSVVGRVRDLGGTATVSGRPGDGVEVVLELPRAVLAPDARAAR